MTLLPLALLACLPLPIAEPEIARGTERRVGRLSMYRPGDGFNAGRLACGGKFTDKQVHVAVRDWRRLGCGRRVFVCTPSTKCCVHAVVRDAGPWGIYRGPLRNAAREGRWKVWTKLRPPPGWRFRAVVDLSWGLWKLLKRPPALSRVRIYVLPPDRRGR